MKCVKNIKRNEVARVTNDYARLLVKSNPKNFVYVAKSEWKKAGRPVTGEADGV